MSKSKKALSRIGLSCALSTPFTSQDMIDLPAFSEHARWTLAKGCDGVTVFGTTGEGASVSTKERITTMSYFAGAGFGQCFGAELDDARMFEFAEAGA